MNGARLTPLDYLMPDVDELRVYEARIAANLNAGQALYSEALERLYFCDNAERSIETTLSQIHASSGEPLRIDTVRLDDKGIFAVARKLSLRAPMKARVYAALRLLGVALRSG